MEPTEFLEKIYNELNFRKLNIMLIFNKIAAY